MLRIVYIHHLSGEHDLEKHLKENFVIKKVFADNDGQMIYQGAPVSLSFFDQHADVVVTSLPVDQHKRFVSAVPHIPAVGINSYHGIFSGGKYREMWHAHAKDKGIKIPHTYLHNPHTSSSFHEVRSKVFLPSVVHVPGNEYGSHAVKTFPELQEYISTLSEPVHIDRHIKGDHVYIISIKDFRDHDVYTTPLLHKTDHGFTVCSHIKAEQKEDAIRFVRELHTELGLGPIAQFEFVVSNNDLYLVHVEPNPHHTENSVLHAGLEAVGSNMGGLWKTIIENAKKRK